MPLLLTRRVLQAMFEDPTCLEQAFQTIQDILREPSPAHFSEMTLPGSSQGAALAVQARRADRESPYVVLRLRSSHDSRVTQLAELLVADDGTLVALAAANELDSWRETMPSGLAARYLAPGAARSLGLYGTGTQAYACARVLTLALPSLSLIRIYGHDLAVARELATAAMQRTGLAVTVETAPRMAASTDVVVLTGGEQPFEREWLQDGALLISQVADGVPAAPDCRRVVARMPVPAAAGRSDPAYTTLADIVSGRALARRWSTETIVYQANEVPGWDVALYVWALRRACQTDEGQRFALD